MNEEPQDVVVGISGVPLADDCKVMGQDEPIVMPEEAQEHEARREARKAKREMDKRKKKKRGESKSSRRRNRK